MSKSILACMTASILASTAAVVTLALAGCQSPTPPAAAAISQNGSAAYQTPQPQGTFAVEKASPAVPRP